MFSTVWLAEALPKAWQYLSDGFLSSPWLPHCAQSSSFGYVLSYKAYKVTTDRYLTFPLVGLRLGEAEK